jgi:hypothetical protein
MGDGGLGVGVEPAACSIVSRSTGRRISRKSILQSGDPSVLRHEDEGAFHVHGGDDEPEMTGVAGEPAIADAA